MTQVESI